MSRGAFPRLVTGSIRGTTGYQEEDLKGVTSRWWKEECEGLGTDEATALYSLDFDTLF